VVKKFGDGPKKPKSPDWRLNVVFFQHDFKQLFHILVDSEDFAG